MDVQKQIFDSVNELSNIINYVFELYSIAHSIKLKQNEKGIFYVLQIDDEKLYNKIKNLSDEIWIQNKMMQFELRTDARYDTFWFDFNNVHCYATLENVYKNRGRFFVSIRLYIPSVAYIEK